MRIHLTGGASFISLHVAERLLDRGHEAAVVDCYFSGKKKNVPDGAVFYEPDVHSEVERGWA
jgi:UDP-glucose 4-epimerase